MSTFLESLTSEYDRSMAIIDSYYEVALSEYKLEKSNAETLYFTESFDENQLEYLYEEAEKKINDKLSKGVETIKEAIKKFCEGIFNKLKGSNEDLADCERKSKTNPFMKKGEVNVEDTTEQISLCEKYLGELKKLGIKLKAGIANKEDIEKLKNKYNSEKNEAKGEKRKMSIPSAISLWKKYGEKPDKTMTDIMNDCININDDGDVVMSRFVSDITKDRASAIYKLVNSSKDAVIRFSKSVMKTETNNTPETKATLESTDEHLDTGFDELLTDLLESVIGDTEELEVFTEEAKFSILPKFKRLKKQYPELEKADNLINLINAELEQDGKEPTPTRCKNIQKILAGFLTFCASASSVVLMPFCVLIIPIFYYLLNRLIVWENANVRFAITESQLLSMISKVKKLVKDADTPKLKKKYEQMLEKLEESLDDLRSFSKSETAVVKALKESDENVIDFSEIMELSNDDKLSFVNNYLKECKMDYVLETCKQINEVIKDKKMEVASDIMEDVCDDYITNSLESVEFY